MRIILIEKVQIADAFQVIMKLMDLLNARSVLQFVRHVMMLLINVQLVIQFLSELENLAHVLMDFSHYMKEPEKLFANNAYCLVLHAHLNKLVQVAQREATE